MIKRYSRPEMNHNWSPESRFHTLFKIEAFACEVMAKEGIIPEDVPAVVWEKGDKPYTSKRMERIATIEKDVKHDIIAFLTELAEQIGPLSRFVHQGMTSSDIIDTCFSIQLKQAAEILLRGLDNLLDILRQKALEYKYTPMMGRSHGIHAEPTTFGLKLLAHYAAFNRNKRRLKVALDDISTCAISGAVGTFAHLSPRIEAYVAQKLDLQVEPISTQVIPRDRHAAFFCTLGVIASSIENLATEIRHLQRSEVGEVAEYFTVNQKGSSAMPHKRNPILTENLTGLARVIRSSVIPALEDVSLWHERDISHSSVERFIAPDTTTTLDFALHRLARVIKDLIVYPEKMMNKLSQTGGLYNSQRVLLCLTQKGISREESYRWVQRNALKAWENGERFHELVRNDEDIAKLIPKEELEDLFDVAYHLKRVDDIFDRVLA